MPKQYIKYLGLTVGLILLFILLFGIGIYKYHWRGSVVRGLARVVPYPAVLVDWEPVRYWTYVDDLAALERYWNAQRENANVFLGIPSGPEIRERLMNKLIEEKLVSQAAREAGIAVTDAETEQEWGRLLAKPDAEREVETFLADAYGWGEERFKERVLVPFLLRRKVAANLAAASGADEAALSLRAREIHAAVREPGADFERIAREAGIASAGDIGYFGRGTFEPQLEKAIFGLDIGQISEPVRSSAGFHIIRLDDALTDAEGVRVQAAAHHILVTSFDFEAWLEEKKDVTSIYRMVR